MKRNLTSRGFGLVLAGTLLPLTLFASAPPPPVIYDINGTGSQKNISFELYPGAQAYTILGTTNPLLPLTPNTNFVLSPYIISTSTNGTNYGYEWRITNATAPVGFYQVQVTPLSSNTLLAANVLNRLAYGPTPDELPRVMSIGPQAYIAEQLNMDGVPETLVESYTVQTTNAIPSDPTTNWTFITMTGTLAQTTFYLFTTAPGEAYLDDIQLRPFRYMHQIVTNVVGTNNVVVSNKVFSYIGPSVLQNGDWESGYSFWTNAGGASASAADNSRAHGGSSCLHLVSSTGANSPGSSYVRQGFVNVGYPTTNTLGDAIMLTNTTTDQVVLSYWYLPGPTTSNLRLQLGSGVNSTPGGIPPTPNWVYATATGTANANSRFYIYISGAGECYVDDVKLVAGSVPEAGTNLLKNGDFEAPLAGTWALSADFTNSTLSTTIAHSGNSSLRLIATAGGGGNNDSVQQNPAGPALTNGQTYTVSYWYLPASQNRTLTVKLDGNVLLSTPDQDLPGVNRRLNTKTAGLAELRAWWCQRAVQSSRQLFEVLSQFWENHFVTQQTKSRDYLNNQGYDGTTADRLATDWEFREMTKWRNAMSNPDCTFYDLLKIHVESPAQIVYLDTVNSKGNGNNIANENYARELLELFTFGVDNGYDQNDIVLLSRAWTGWSVEIVDNANADNPFAPQSLTYYPGTNSTSRANTIGTWAFNFKSANHGTNRGAIFGGKTVPARFGAPWAGIPYQIVLPARGQVTNGIQDGYDVITNLANLPFTSEYISVKLCRLFVHDDFPNPNSTDTNIIGYKFYDYTDPNRTPEAELVHQCMLAWENSTPRKGNLRAVLNTIFSSDLFRSHTAAGHKVKTPFEFVTSAIRALRSVNANGSATASTDGYSQTTPMSRMGEMLLFDRGAPDGYPEEASPWISSGTLVERSRYIQAFLNAGTGDDAGNNVCDPVALVNKKIPGSLNNAAAVTDYFLNLLFPGEGAGNLALYRDAAIKYLNTADNGSSSPYSGLNAANTDTRLRNMIVLLLTSPRFQEQ